MLLDDLNSFAKLLTGGSDMCQKTDSIDVFSAIQHRRSIRKYSAKSIDEEKLLKSLKPSACRLLQGMLKTGGSL